MTVTILSKNPPGGRCSLYSRYAEELSRRFDLDVQINYLETPPEDGCCPPAILVRGAEVTASDGVIISPEDLCEKLAVMGFEAAKLAELRAALEQILENLFAEQAHAQ